MFKALGGFSLFEFVAIVIISATLTLGIVLFVAIAILGWVPPVITSG